jgi:hypothetical protein
MYFFTMYNLSGIQKGIQAGHAAIEYALAYSEDPAYQNWARNHKTFIVLNGGSSVGMEDRLKELEELNIPHAIFREPDLNDSISAIAFLVHEEEYAPDPDDLNPSATSLYLKRFYLASN